MHICCKVLPNVAIIISFISPLNTHTHTHSQFLDSNKSRTSFASSHPPAASAPPITITASEVGQNLFLAKELKKAFVSLQQEKVIIAHHLTKFVMLCSVAMVLGSVAMVLDSIAMVLGSVAMVMGSVAMVMLVRLSHFSIGSLNLALLLEF